jgi:hypothetical protein
MMKDETNLRINNIIITAAALTLALDLAAKVTELGYPFMSTMKWLTTCFYPIVADYVFLFACTFKASDVAFFNSPKLEAKLLFAIKYIFFGVGILLLPSCLNFWFKFAPTLLSTLKIAMVAIFALASFLLIIIAAKSVPSTRKDKPEMNQDITRINIQLRRL